jgi:uridine kinase
MTEEPKIIKPILIGIAGGSACGKRTLLNEIKQEIKDYKVCVISLDSYYKDLPQDTNISEYNFDLPQAFDFELLLNHIKDLRNGKTIEMNLYDFKENKKSNIKTKIESCPIIIIEGIFGFYDSRIRNLMDLKIFIDTDSDIRLSRIIYRDISERGRDLLTSIERYHKFVKPGYEEFVAPTRKYADIIIPTGAHNMPVNQIITEYLKMQLKKIEDNFDTSNLFTSMNEVIDPKYQFFDKKILVSNDNNQIDFIKQVFLDFLKEEQEKDFIENIREKLINILPSILIRYSKENEYLAKNLETIELFISENDDINNIDFTQYKNIFYFKTLILIEDDMKVPNLISSKNEDCKVTVNTIFLAPKFSEISLSNKIDTLIFNTLYFSDFFIKFEALIRKDKTVFDSHELDKLFISTMKNLFKKENK